MRLFGSLLSGVLMIAVLCGPARGELNSEKLNAAKLHAGELRADELLLVANESVFESVPLAKYYAQVRGVSVDRLLVIKTRTGEEITHDEYLQNVYGPVQTYLQSESGKSVRCVVLFYGIPLRIANLTSTPAQRNELKRIKALTETTAVQLPKLADRIDVALRTFDGTPAVIQLPGVDAATVARLRVESTQRAMVALIRESAPAKQQAIIGELQEVQKASVASARLVLRSPAGIEPVFDAFAQQAARRERVANEAGITGLYALLNEQMIELSTDETGASVDSELACVLWPAYTKHRWQINPLAADAQLPRPVNARTMMTARIDGPTPQIARRIIDDAMAVEQAGLHGRVAFDSRGKTINPAQQPPDGYALYDQTIRQAVTYLQKNTSFDVFADDREALIPPGAATDVALYCGWYSVRNYVASCTFVRGAIAYHVASAELESLRTPKERGWGANLLHDGACVTLGPVAEPYLHSFPKPDIFFPLLLTGKLTVAQAYWLSTPMTSWMQVFIGDPLYNPYRKTPAISVDQLPAVLKIAVDMIEATAASGR
jgi:uncharacterized protein (TIGR03790 family)